jgi:hypothetical protein
MRMKRWMLGVLVIAAAAGCKDKAAAPPSTEFDARWSELEKQGAEPVFIEGELHGGGLMGEVRRAVDPVSEGAPLRAAPIQGALPDLEVVKVIRANLPAVKGCYQIEERAGTIGSGKAIVTLEIDGASGAVTNVSIDAPAFSASHLPSCVTARARNWTFPKFTSKSKKFSYPFVFVGG